MSYRFTSASRLRTLLLVLFVLPLGLVGCDSTEDEDPGLGTGLCSDFDLDSDDRVDEDEFGTGLFGLWDTDDDDFLAEDEFDTGIADDDAFADLGGFYDTWDTDDDDLLSDDEFGVGFEESGLFDTFDADNDAFLDADECGDLGF